MELRVEFLQGHRKGRAFGLSPAHINSGLAAEYVLERDVLLLTLHSERFLENVVLHIGGYDIQSENTENSDGTHCYTWRPKDKKPYGYEALFHNFFGIAELFVGYALPGEPQHYIAYQPFEVMATKLTAERTESMVSFIMGNSDEGIIKAISPTHLEASQVRNGVAPGELLVLLERTVQDAYELCRPIIKKPMTRLRSRLNTLYGRECEVSEDKGIGWVLNNLSVLYAVPDPDDALLEHEGNWYAATEIQSSTAHESTNIYENQLIHLFLSRIRHQAERIIEGLSVQEQKFVPHAIPPEGYVSFFNMMQHSVGRTTNTDISRARVCIKRIEELCLILRHKVPADPWRVRNVELTERIKLNSDYLRLMGVMKRWFSDRQIDWQQHNFLASINSTPILFELYCCLTINCYLRSHGDDHNIGKGLFRGTLAGNQMQLHHEPDYWKSGHAKGQYDAYVNTDIAKLKNSVADKLGKVRNGPYEKRSPDFVIEVARNSGVDTNPYSLLVLDAKYMMESKVFEEELHKCTMKYVHGIHSKDGDSIVKTMILLHPDTHSEPGRYLSYHTSPYDINGHLPVYPVLGVQAMVVNSSGMEKGLFSLLDTIIKKL
jgi:hypothetical protein